MKVFEAQKLLWTHLGQDSKEEDRRSLLEFLCRIPLFKDLSRWQLKKLSEILYARRYDEGEYLFERGQPGAALFLIRSGYVLVEVEDSKGEPLTVAELREGTFLGELALLDQSPRSASAKAVSGTKAYALFRSDLEEFVRKDPETTTHIYKSLALVVGERLKATNELFTREKVA